MLWKNEDGESVEEIGRRLRRCVSTLWRLFGEPERERGVGRKASLTEADKDRLVKFTEVMVDEADCCYTVTMAMIHKRFGMSVGVRCLSDALHERGLWFQRLREKPVLTDDDVAQRFAFAKLYRHKTSLWWRRHLQLHMDNHVSKTPLTGKGRRMLATRRVRGVYRTKKTGLKQSHVRPGRKLKQNTNARSVLVAGGVGNGKVLLWKVIEGTWCADEAVSLYKGAVRDCLKTEYPTRRSWAVLEDGDPSGYATKLAVKAKEESKIESFRIPPRSPDLNVMDYWFWAELEGRLRRQERKMDGAKREERDEFIKRMRRTAKSIPADMIERAIGDMAWRVEKLYQAKGKLFEEGGRRRAALRERANV